MGGYNNYEGGSNVVLGAVNMMGGFIFGYNTGIIAGIIGVLADKYKLSSGTQGVVTASILIGALFGSMVGGPISDKLGRKAGLVVLAIITIVGAPLLAISDTIADKAKAHDPVDFIIVTRAFLGLGVGMSGVICPMYVSETASADKRGPLGILFQLAITIGIFVAYVVNYALADISHSYQVMFGLGAIPGLVLLFLAFVTPESPVWLSNRRAGLGEGSSLLHTNNSDPSLALGARVVLFLQSRALYIGIVLAVAQQLTGINAFMYYAKSIFQSAHITNPNYPTMGLGAWNAVTTVLAIPLIDRAGRRPLLIVGTLIMTVACMGLGVVYHVTSGTTLGVLAVLLLFLFIAAFEVGDGPLFWVVAHELFTPETKTIGASTLNALQWLFNIALTLGFPTIQEKIGADVFYIFGGAGAICFVIMFFALPETRTRNDL